MLTDGFCERLEYKINDALKSYHGETLKGFWCDGVLLPDENSEYSKKAVNDNREIQLKAFIGQTGQDKYRLTLRLGSKALSKYSRGLDILDCIPNTSTNWLDIDLAKKEVWLNFE